MSVTAPLSPDEKSDESMVDYSASHVSNGSSFPSHVIKDTMISPTVSNSSTHASFSPPPPSSQQQNTSSIPIHRSASSQLVGGPHHVPPHPHPKSTPRKYHAFSMDTLDPALTISGSNSAGAGTRGGDGGGDDMFEPVEGTPLAEALAANAAIKIDRNLKNIQKKWRGIKRPKLKTKNLKKFNVVRQINRNIKHKKKEKLFSKNFKGKVIDGVHELYTLTVGMMLGLRCTVGGAKENNKMELVLEDFNAVDKREFRPTGTSTPLYKTPPHSLGHTFKFKSYAPEVFKRIRQFCGVDTASYMMSICGNASFIEFMSNSKSGQFFFYSHDGKYMIKTQSKEENRFMKKILPYYYQFLIENPNSTLVRFLGMHRVKMYHLRRKHHFVIMTSVFDTPMQIHTIYDLKGSRVGREATEKEKASGGVLKDNDLADAGRKFHLGSKKERLMEQIEKDAMFLASLNIMDYSLLVGIHDRKSAAAQRDRDLEAAAQQHLQNESVSPSLLNGGLDAAFATSTSPHVSTHSNTPFRLHVKSTSSDPAAAAAYQQAVHNVHANNASASASTSQQAHAASSHSLASASSSSMLPPPPQHLSQHQQPVPPLPPPVSARSTSSSADANDPTTNGAAPLSVGPASSGRPHSSNTPARRSSQHRSSAKQRNSHEWDGAAGGGINGIGRDNSASEESEDEEEYDEEEDDDDEYDDESNASDSVFGDTLTQQHTRANQGASRQLTNDEINEREINHLKEILGLGAKGVEGAKVAQLFISADRFAQMTATTIQRDNELVRHMSTIHMRKNNVFVTRPWTSRPDGGINSRMSNPSARGDEVYFLGIIDILQQYNFRKRSETFFKSFNEDVNLISSVNPVMYAKRFVQFLRDNSD